MEKQLFVVSRMLNSIDFFFDLLMWFLSDLSFHELLIDEVLWDIQSWMLKIVRLAFYIEFEVSIEFSYRIKHHSMESKGALSDENVKHASWQNQRVWLSFFFKWLSQVLHEKKNEFVQIVQSINIFEQW